jgi:hypothetical protein
VLESFPEFREYIDPRDLHDMTFEQLRRKVTIHMFEHKMKTSATKIQRFYRTKTAAGKLWAHVTKIVSSAKMIQRNYRTSRWIRLINKMIKEKKRRAAVMI